MATIDPLTCERPSPNCSTSSSFPNCLSHQLGVNVKIKLGGEYAKRVSALPPSPPHFEGVSASPLASHCDRHFLLIFDVSLEQIRDYVRNRGRMELDLPGLLQKATSR